MINHQNIAHHFGLCKGGGTVYTAARTPLQARITSFPFPCDYPLQEVLWTAAAFVIAGASLKYRVGQNPFDVAECGFVDCASLGHPE